MFTFCLTVRSYRMYSLYRSHPIERLVIRTRLQASLSAAVLFASYVAQVHYRPFLPVKSVSDSFVQIVTLGKARRASKAAAALGSIPGSTVPSNASSSPPPDMDPVWASAVDMFADVIADSEEVSSQKPTARPALTTRASRRALIAREPSARRLPRQSSAGAGSSAANDAIRRAAALLSKAHVTRVIDYNNLESTFVLTAMLVLLGGMVFNSTAFSKGSVGYVFMTVVVVIIIIGTVLSFVALILFEVYRAIRYANVHAAAREMESAATELRLLSTKSAGSGRGLGRKSSAFQVRKLPFFNDETRIFALLWRCESRLLLFVTTHRSVTPFGTPRRH